MGYYLPYLRSLRQGKRDRSLVKEGLALVRLALVHLTAFSFFFLFLLIKRNFLKPSGSNEKGKKS